MPTSCREDLQSPAPVTISGGRDPELDAICRTAAALFGTRYAFVSHPGSEYQWYIGSSGMSVGKIPRAQTFCVNARSDGSREPLVVLDARRDPRFSQLPFVRESPHLRFYAGVSIALREALGEATVCVADVESRKRFSVYDERRLLDLALFVEAILTMRPARLDRPSG